MNFRVRFEPRIFVEGPAWEVVVEVADILIEWAISPGLYVERSAKRMLPEGYRLADYWLAHPLFPH